MEEILNSPWTITIVGGVTASILGTAVSTVLMGGLPGINAGSSGCGVTIMFLAAVAAFEVIATYAAVFLVYPMFSRAMGNEFGLLLTFFTWLIAAAGIPGTVSRELF